MSAQGTRSALGALSAECMGSVGAVCGMVIHRPRAVRGRAADVEVAVAVETARPGLDKAVGTIDDDLVFGCDGAAGILEHTERVGVKTYNRRVCTRDLLRVCVSNEHSISLQRTQTHVTIHRVFTYSSE
mgnify:CR=1 FL=1